MSGPKAYTMKEMKGIVEYLVEHKAYGEIRGRKMWVDYANSSLTTRTWQSLKETFLKRILPDIQNPYYHLTRDQVCSFKQGVDVEAKEKNNRLEIRTVSEESTNNAEKATDIEQPSTSAEIRNEAEKTLGEEIKSATITVRNRSSADTFIIDEDTESRHSPDDPQVSKKTTEELLEELGEPPKSLKECLDFEPSEPPCAVRKVLEDFETESEGSDKEPQMEIVEDISENVNQEVIVVEDSENVDNVEFIEERIVVEGGVEVDIGPTFDHEIITEVTTTDLQGLNNWLEGCAQTEQQIPAEKEGDESVVQEITAEQNGDAGRNEPREETEPLPVEAPENITERPKENKKPIDSENNNQSSLNATSDTIIPNNQEVLDATKSQKTSSKFDILAPLKDASRKRSTSPDKTVSKKKKRDNGIEMKTNGDAIEVTPISSNNTEAAFEALKKSDKVDDSTIQDAQDIDELPQNKNPCLKSVSLFEEQFNTTKYSDSEEDTPIPINKEKITENTVIVSAEDNQPNNMKDAPPSDKIKVTTDPAVQDKQKETIETELPTPTKQKISKSDRPVIKKHKIDKSTEMDFPILEKQDYIVLMSNSDSDVQQTPPSERPRPKERFKHLAQAFGFVPGTSKTAAQRRRSLRSRNRTKSQRNSCTLLEDSDWEGSISEPELADEFISPPRGRRNRTANKYRKPRSGRLVALGEEGALFLLNGNRIVPIVKNGKPLTYVTYDSLAVSEEDEELMWRQKYIDEKKKAAALKRQLEEVQKPGTSRSKSPTLPIPTRNIQSTSSVQNPTGTDMNKQMNIKHVPGGKIQIILSKNNEETVNLQGNWPEVLPVVQNLMTMFYKTDDTSTATKPSEPTKEDISGIVTLILPVSDTNARNVDDLESEIFKKIEEQAKIDETKTSNVTKRKGGRPKKTPSTSSEQSETVAKRPRRSKSSLKDKTAKTENNKMADEKPTKNKTIDITERLSLESVEPVNVKPPAEDNLDAVEATAQAQDKVVNAESVKIPVGPTEPRVTRSRKSGNETDTSTRTITTRLSALPKANEDEVRYMFPPGPKSRTSRKLTPNKRSCENPHETSQEDFKNSVDSTQGYQDSDASPAKVNTTKRKRKVSVTVRKGKYVPRRKSLPAIPIHDISFESSNSSYFIPKKSKSQSTLDSAIYKTESYQILMGNRKLSLKKLDVIDETSKSDDLRRSNTVSSNNSNMVLEVGSSSNVSLPLSPELSVVENLSISREMIQSNNHPTINEMQANDSVVNKIYNQYLISDVDVSIPLMQQDCELLNTRSGAKSKVKKQKTPIKVSDLLKKVPVVNMTINNTLSDTLDRKLRDLLLESAKKISDCNKENLMDIDKSSVVEPKKTKGKKRCSTPRKRASTKKPKPSVEPIIDEHMESCSRGGRNSCPPVITFIPLDENANNSADVQLNAKPKPKPKVKKDVIRVKIQRPGSTRIVKELETAVGNISKISVYTDSGINETASISEQLFQGDSVELIHNHSETCLQANECIGNSIEFVENSKSESIISVNSPTSLECELLKVMNDVEILSEGYRNRNAKDASSGEKSSEDVFETPTDTIYHSPIANCSLLTDDLSDEVPITSTKWYLFSEDDTNNTNWRPEQMKSNTRVSNFSSNLNQLFPVTCAVPDLSTISEMSKENEGSKKGFDTDGDTRSSDYQSLV